MSEQFIELSLMKIELFPFRVLTDLLRTVQVRDISPPIRDPK